MAYKWIKWCRCLIKSTTINILLGFLEPDEGEAFIDGIDVTTNDDSARKKIGYISENVNLYPYLTGLENLNYFCKIALGKDYNDEIYALSKILNNCLTWLFRAR